MTFPLKIPFGLNMRTIINIAKEVRNHNSEIGLCMMGYLNNLFIYGIEKFAKDISGIIDAVICVDLPSDVVEEKQLNDALKKENIALIKLITPTTSEERIKEDYLRILRYFRFYFNYSNSKIPPNIAITKINCKIIEIIMKIQLNY